MPKWISLLTELNPLSVSIRVLLAIMFGGFIGVERQGKHHPAGLRTHILVCLGSCLTMMLGQYMYNMYGSDPSRIGAQVVSGIGFLGVGTIMMRKSHVRGITTAAGLWACACMGLAIGAGFYEGALIGFAGIAFTLIVVRKISKKYNMRHPRRKELYLQLTSLQDMIYISKMLKVLGVETASIKISNSEEEEDTDHEENSYISVLMEIVIANQVDSGMIMASLLQEKCVLYADYHRPFSDFFGGDKNNDSNADND